MVEQEQNKIWQNIALSAFCLIIALTLTKNFFIIESQISDKIKQDFEEVNNVLDVDRGRTQSIITVETHSGTQVNICVSSDVLFQYKYKTCEV